MSDTTPMPEKIERLEIENDFLAKEVQRLRHRVAELERAAAAENNFWQSATWSPEFGCFVAVSHIRAMWSDDGENWNAADADGQPALTDNWPTCQGNEMPPELAPAQIVVRRSEDGAFGITCRADADAWHPGDQYRPAIDDDGLPMVSREGLKPDTQYVATDQDGDVGQYAREPFTIESVGWWKNIRASSWAFAPDTHKIPGDWRDSLASVWDGEG